MPCGIDPGADPVVPAPLQGGYNRRRSTVVLGRSSKSWDFLRETRLGCSLTRTLPWLYLLRTDFLIDFTACRERIP
jgi:hypothetical protein